MTLVPMVSRVGLLSFLAAVTLGLSLASPAAAYCRLTTKSPSASEGRPPPMGCIDDGGVPLAWQRRCISYTVVPSERLGIGLDDVRAVIDRSFSAWMDVQCAGQPVPVMLGQTEQLGECSFAEYNRFGPNANTIAFASDWATRGADFLPEAYGLTLVWHNPDTGEILDADIQINLSHGEPVAICGDTCDAANIDLQNVLTHEAGHFLGLAHSPDKAATMYGDAEIAELTKRDLELDDVRGICAIYGSEPMPACEPPDYAPRRGFSAECARPMPSSTCAAQPGRTSRGMLGAAAFAALGLAWLARRRRARTQLVLSIALLACGAGDASAFCRLTTAAPAGAGGCTTEGEGLAWERQCVSYTVVPPANDALDLEELRDVIDSAFAAWSAVDCGAGRLPLALGQTEQLGECSTAQYNQEDGNANTIMFVDGAEVEDFPSDAFGLTLVWHDPARGTIFDADIQLNAGIAPFAICGETCESNVSDLANVVTHEAGHFLGLGHSAERAATMSASSLLGDTDKRSLEADDRAGVCAIYGDYDEPSCAADDYQPDRGFTAECVVELPLCDELDAMAKEQECREPKEPEATSKSRSSGGCAARSGLQGEERTSRTMLGAVALGLGGWLLVTRRRKRRARLI
jgi:hypothetical protein